MTYNYINLASKADNSHKRHTRRVKTPDTCPPPLDIHTLVQVISAVAHHNRN